MIGRRPYSDWLQLRGAKPKTVACPLSDVAALCVPRAAGPGQNASEHHPGSSD
jgi:hypothetical protein